MEILPKIRRAPKKSFQSHFKPSIKIEFLFHFILFGNVAIDCVIISSETNAARRSEYATNDGFKSYNHSGIVNAHGKSEQAAKNYMSIIFTNSSSTISGDQMNNQTNKTNSTSYSMPSSIDCKPISNFAYKSQYINNNTNGSNPHQTNNSKLMTPKLNETGEQIYPHSNNERQYFYETPSESTLSNGATQTPTTTATCGTVYRERSIEETEAAHDLLSLSQSLPPLPAPCVVTILHPVSNYIVNSPDVHEIASSKEYITYDSNDSIDQRTTNTNYNNKSTNCSTQNVADNHIKKNLHSATNNQNGYESDNTTISSLRGASSNNKTVQLKSQIIPLTPPTSESDVELISETVIKNRSKSTLQTTKSKKFHQNQPKSTQKSKSAQVIGMTIFDSVMINDGRSKKGNGDAEVIHIEEKRKGRYKCPQCGKQYATSSNLSRHKQTHRSLDSQSAKKCMTCGKAYVSMPALAMHLLTHKLTHSCDVCGKLFSRPWLLQGHLRSHTGEKPYGCAHCGKGIFAFYSVFMISITK